MAISPIVQLANGITTGDWTKVCKAHEALTGEKLSPPITSVVIGDVIAESMLDIDTHLRAAITIIHDLGEGRLPVRDVDSAPISPPETRTIRKKSPSKTLTKKAPKKPVQEVRLPAPVDPLEKFRMKPKARKPKEGEEDKNPCQTEDFQPGMKNTFKDDGKIAAKHIKESRSQSPVEKEVRETVIYVEAKCSNCSNVDRVPEEIAGLNSGKDSSGYRCNRCVPGGRR